MYGLSFFGSVAIHPKYIMGFNFVTHENYYFVSTKLPALIISNDFYLMWAMCNALYIQLNLNMIVVILGNRVCNKSMYIVTVVSISLEYACGRLVTILQLIPNPMAVCQIKAA